MARRAAHANFGEVLPSDTVAGHPTSASVTNATYMYAASYDDDLRLSSSSLTNSGTGTTLYSTSRTYDGVGNVTGVRTTLAAGTDNQSFCYDEQNRLVWATSQSVLGPCQIINSAGTLTAQGSLYTAGYAYDPLDRLTSSPLGSYTYGSGGSGTPLHAASSVSSGGGTVYSATYGAAGNMDCRAPSSSTTCSGGTPNGAGLGYDNAGQLVKWQNTLAGTPSTVAHFAYDGEGRRVSQSLTTGGTTVKTRYVLGLEEQSGDVSKQPITKYESVPGVCDVVIVGSGPTESISYVTTDGLGSVSEALDGNGNVTAQQLYGPYGGVRYSSGTMPTAKGFTGQYADATTGLDYYGARYYDPLAGQFISADSAAKGGLNRYAYVADDPETATDPTGHVYCPGTCSGGGGGGSSGGGGGSGHGGGCQTNCSPPKGPGGCYNSRGCEFGQDARACSGWSGLCGLIVNTFHDWHTQGVLMLLLYTSLGREFLNFLLAAGMSDPLGADRYIRWDYPGEGGAYTDWSGRILMSDSLQSNPLDALDGLVHEAVESFYALADGIRSYASQHMDYVADWFAGEVAIETAPSLGMLVPSIGGHDSGAYQQTLQQWETNNGTPYATCPGPDCEPVNQPEAQQGGGFWASLIANSGLPDGMGLSVAMLRSNDLGGPLPLPVIPFPTPPILLH